jgi:hypothetical protein
LIRVGDLELSKATLGSSVRGDARLARRVSFVAGRARWRSGHNPNDRHRVLSARFMANYRNRRFFSAQDAISLGHGQLDNAGVCA